MTGAALSPSEDAARLAEYVRKNMRYVDRIVTLLDAHKHEHSDLSVAHHNATGHRSFMNSLASALDALAKSCQDESGGTDDTASGNLGPQTS